MREFESLSRREFVRLAAAGFGALLLPVHLSKSMAARIDWPYLHLTSVPNNVQEILSLVPQTVIGEDGSLFLMGSKDHLAGRVPLAQTLWNKEHSFRGDRLYTTVPWGIVLHWYGDKENFDKTVKGYLRGFDSLRKIDEQETRTSAHFLVGGARPTINLDSEDAPIGILQTQKPASNGTPYVASHISGLDYEAHVNRKQYFVRAYYQLGYEEPGVHTILQDWFDGGQTIDPNMRTIAIEITGYDFDNLSHFPPRQQVANLISLIWALMRRYRITANNIFGHNEIQLNKPDPGKKFMGLIRYLVGLKALLENDPYMNQLVFGNYLLATSDGQLAVAKYFKFVYDYLLMVSRPNHVYEWEGQSGYWFVRDMVDGHSSPAIGRRFLSPLVCRFDDPGRSFTQPENHEGIDLYQDGYSRLKDLPEDQVLLVTPGKCIYLGDFDGCTGGKVAIFRHRQLNGAQVLSVYGHLDRLNDLSLGLEYPTHYPIGGMLSDRSHQEPFLHFAMAYGATWDSDLKDQPSLPLNVGAYWIRERYMSPLNLMSGGYGSSSQSYHVI